VNGRSWYESFVRHAKNKNDEEWVEYRNRMNILLVTLKLEGRDGTGWVSTVMEALQRADEYRRLHCQNDPDAPAG